MRIRTWAACLVAVGGLAVAAQETKAIKEAMAAHKGQDSMVNKIISGKGSDEEHKKLLALYEAMAGQKPPMGDEASWKAKTSELIAAAKEVVEKKPGATDHLKKASDCKACHSVHKPKK
jgi:hypothetical protein